MNALDQLADKKRQLAYSQNVLNNETLENWERREFVEVVKTLESEILQLRNHINSYPEVFNTVV